MSDFTSGTLTTTATAPSGIASSTSQLILYTTGCGGAAFTVSNASGTVGFWASADGGANWAAMGVSPAVGGTLVTTASAAGLWQVNCSGYTHVGLVASAVTGGGITASIHTSPISAFESGGGGGPGGGMVPPGSTGIVNSLFTTSGASGAATYNPSTGAMNIPIYAPGTLNYVSTALPSTITVTGTTVVSSGFGTTAQFTALSNPLALVCFNWNIQLTGANTAAFAPIYRTTGTIPANMAAIGTGDVELIRPRYFVGATGNPTSIAGSFLDTGLLVGTAYRYYLAAYSTVAQTITFVNAPAGTVSLQVVELK